MDSFQHSQSSTAMDPNQLFPVAAMVMLLECINQFHAPIPLPIMFVEKMQHVVRVLC